MGQPTIYASLDIGTTSVKVVVAEYVNQNMNILGVGNEPTDGLSRGVIVDIDKTVDAIKKAVSQAERKSNCQISNVIVSVPANQIQIEACYGMIAVANENEEITDADVYNVLAAAKVKAVPPEREIISVIPEEFVVDGFDGIKDPRGMIGVRLELYASMITGTKTIIHNIKRCVERADLNIADLVVSPLATAAVALSEGEREFGTILIDLGGGQSSASVIHEQQLKFAFIDQEGGEYISRDISKVLNTTVDNAERIKLEYGVADATQTSESEYFPVQVIGKSEPARIDEHYLSEIIESRAVQIFETLKRALDQVDAFSLPGGVVMTGGSAALPGMVELASDILGTEVRFYIPELVGLRNPIYATAIGLIEYANGLEDIYHVAQGGNYDNTMQKAAYRSSASKAVSSPERIGNAYNHVEPVVKNTNEARVSPETAQTVAKAKKPEKAKMKNDNSFTDKIKDFFDDIFS